MQAKDLVKQICENCDRSMFSKTTELIIALGLIKEFNMKDYVKEISEIVYTEIHIKSNLKHYNSESDLLIKEYFETFEKKCAPKGIS